VEGGWEQRRVVEGKVRGGGEKGGGRWGKEGGGGRGEEGGR